MTNQYDPKKEQERQELRELLGGNNYERSWSEAGNDLKQSLKSGGVGAVNAVLGLANLQSKGQAGKNFQERVWDTHKTQQEIQAKKSDTSKMQQGQFENAEGFGAKLGTVLKNPLMAVDATVESLPSMLAGGVMGRAVGGIAGIGGGVARGAIGEGMAMTGSAAENLRSHNKDGLLTGRDYVASVGTGVGGAGLGYAGGKLAQKLGISDVDTMVAGGVRNTINEAKQNATKGGIGYGLAGIGKGAIAEGVFEELPQTILETGLENWAKGRDLTENMAGNAALGLVSGGMMGGVAGGASSNWRKLPTPDTDSTKNQTDSTPQPPDNGGNTPLSPDGSPISPTSPNNPNSPNSPNNGNGGVYFDMPHNENQAVGFHGNPVIDTPAIGLQNSIEHTSLDTQAERTDTTAPKTEPISQVGQTEKATPDVQQIANGQDVASEPTPQNIPLADVNPQTFANPQNFDSWLNQEEFVNQYKAQQELNDQKPSERMGLDPNQGSLTRSAVVAVDSGATQAINPQAGVVAGATGEQAQEGTLARASMQSEPLSAYQTQLQERTAQQEVQAQEAKAVFANAPKLIGKQNYIQNQNERLPTQIMAVEADSLMPSVDNTTNQARDRSRTASRVQVDNIANNLDPMQLTDSTVMGHGSPTISDDGTIIAGNGRTMAIKQAYLQGKADEYRQMLMERADEYGLDKTALAGMKNPVLVKSVGNVGVDKLRQLALNSNETGTMTQSAFENARADVERVANINLNQLHADERGDINTSSNRHIINEFVSQFPIEQQNAMRTSNGVLSKQGLERFENALLLSAYGDNPTTQAILESTDEEVRNVVKAIVATSPTVAKTKQGIQDGITPNDDIASDITEALSMLAKLRREGVKPSDYLAQTNLFGDELSPTGQRLLAFMDENIRSVVKIRQLLYKYYDNLSQENLKQDDMFGKETQTKQSRLNQALQELGHDQFVQPITATTTATAEQVRPTSQASQVNERPEKSVSDEQGIGRDDGQVTQKPKNALDGLKSKREAKAKAKINPNAKLRADWGVDRIDGFAESNEFTSDWSHENSTPLKDVFLKDGENYLKSVQAQLESSVGRDTNQSTNGNDSERSSGVQPDGAKTGLSSGVNKKQPTLTPKDEAKQVLQGEVVAHIDESKLNMPTSGGYKAVTAWAMDLFNQWDNVANSPILGDVILNEQSIRDSISHDKKLNPYKNLALASIKDVLEKGVLIHADYNTKGEDSFYIAAPVMLNNNKNIVTVLVHRDVNTQRMYLHYVGLVEKLMQSHQNMTVAQDKTSRKHNRSATASDIASIIQGLLDVKHDTQTTAQALDNALSTTNAPTFALSDEMVQTGVSERVNADFASYIKNHDTLAKATKAYFDDHLKGKAFDTVIGKVHILGSSWQKKLKAGISNQKVDEVKAFAIPFISDILTNGHYDGVWGANKERKDAYVRFHSFSKEVSIRNKPTFVRVLVGERENNEFELVVYNLYPNKKSDDNSITLIGEPSDFDESIANSNQKNKQKETPNSSGLSEVTKAPLGDGDSLTKSDDIVNTTKDLDSHLTNSQKRALEAIEKLPDSDSKKAQFLDELYQLDPSDSKEASDERYRFVTRVSAYELVQRKAHELAGELTDLGYIVKVADNTVFDNTQEVATQLSIKKNEKTLNVVVNKTIQQGRANDTSRDGFFVKDGTVSYKLDLYEMNVGERIHNHADYVSNKQYFGKDRPIYHQNPKPTDWQQRMAGQLARLYDDDPALAGFIEQANNKELPPGQKNSLLQSIKHYASIQHKKGNALAEHEAMSQHNDTYHKGKMRFSQMGGVVASISEQAKVLQGEPITIIDESTLDMPQEGGFNAIQKWATELFAKQGGKAVNSTLGEVVLNHRSVKDSLAHGKFSPFKNVAFAGVKDVLEKGVVIAQDINEFEEESFYISAPVTMNGKENIITVTVHKDSNSQRMYLHGVMLKENLLKPRVSATLEKTSRTHYGSLTSADIHNILQKALTYKEQNNSRQGSRFGTTADEVLDALNYRFGKDTIAKLQANNSLKVLSLAQAREQFGNIPDDVDGFYTDGTAYLIHDNIHPDMIVPTFLHELGGHGGLQTLMSERAYQSLLNEFHDMVARGDETAKQAKALADRHSRTQAEADSEYLTYMITLAGRNNSSKAKSLMNRVIMAVKTFLKNTFGISLALTPNDILALSEKMVRDRANGQMGSGIDDVRFSLDESENSDFARAVDEIVAGKRKKGFVRLGKTPDVLKMLGVIDGTVRISRDVLEKSMANVLKRRTYFRHTHSVTPKMMKELPKQLNNPIAVFKSSSVDGAMVVLTELTEHSKGKDKPVVATLHFETTKKGVELVNIASVYGRSKSQLKTAFNDDLLYLHKEKGQQFLTTMELQLHQDFTSKNADLSTHNIKTDDDLSQYQNENNIDDIQFSRMADMADFYDKNQDKAKEVLGRLGGVVNDFINNPKSFIKQGASNAKADHLDKFLQFLGRRQLTDLYGKKLQGLKEYNDRVAQMDADSNETAFRADQLVNKWAKVKDSEQLAELMHDVTLLGIDPTAPVKGAKNAKHAQLKARYDRLSDMAKEVFNQAKDDYQTHYESLHRAMVERIQRNDKLSDERKAKLIDELDKELQVSKKAFFPLTRFGNYVVVVRDTDGNVVNVARAETKGQADEVRRQLIKDNPNHKVGQVTLGREMDIRNLSGIKGLASEFLADDLGLDDQLHQDYLNALLDRQFATNNVMIKNTAGFSQNARRAYAHHMSRGSHHIAKLRHTDRLKADLELMQAYIDNQDDDVIELQRVLDELNKRHKLLLNPPSHPVSSLATAVGFMWYMGLSPASALVNLSQTLLVAMPMMSAKYGFAKSNKMLGEISGLLAKNKNDLSNALTGNEKKAFDEAVRRGVIDMTQAHDLAGVANGENSAVMEKIKPVMKVASFMFHQAEKFNRQVTFVASYRLAVQKGLTSEQAMEEAIKITYDGHFDYASSNRPRFMQGNWQRVLFLFKQYGQNMVYTLTRNTYLSFKGETPEQKREARKIMAGILAGHAMSAGVLGLPLVTTLLAVASALGGDDDEPWDAEVALRNQLAELLGDDVAEVIAKGVPRAVGVDLSSRVGLDSLILPRLQDGLEGQRLGENLIIGLAGPVMNIPVSITKGMGQIGQGQTLQGIENMIPKALRDPLKAYRYATQGNVDKSGIEIVEKENVGISDIAQQAIGFRSGKFAQAQEVKSAIYQADKQLTAIRSDLVRQYALAKRNGDDEQMDRIWEEIKRFNVKHPSVKITKPALMQSIRQRQRRIDNAKDGIYLNKNREHLREYGAFGVD